MIEGVGDKQRIFSKNLALLIIWTTNKLEWSVSIKEVLRTQSQADANALSGVGISHSLHLLGLAADLSLFIHGIYQTDSASYEEMGDYWKSLHPLNRWGGDFKDAKGEPKHDGNHFSMEHNGIK